MGGKRYGRGRHYFEAPPVSVCLFDSRGHVFVFVQRFCRSFVSHEGV